jgi:hypothetical protein
MTADRSGHMASDIRVRNVRSRLKRTPTLRMGSVGSAMRQVSATVVAKSNTERRSRPRAVPRPVEASILCPCRAPRRQRLLCRTGVRRIRQTPPGVAKCALARAPARSQKCDPRAQSTTESYFVHAKCDHALRHRSAIGRPFGRRAARCTSWHKPNGTASPLSRRDEFVA